MSELNKRDRLLVAQSLHDFADSDPTKTVQALAIAGKLRLFVEAGEPAAALSATDATALPALTSADKAFLAEALFCSNAMRGDAAQGDLKLDVSLAAVKTGVFTEWMELLKADANRHPHTGETDANEHAQMPALAQRR